jgi:hypothetical protein
MYYINEKKLEYMKTGWFRNEHTSRHLKIRCPDWTRSNLKVWFGIVSEMFNPNVAYWFKLWFGSITQTAEHVKSQNSYNVDYRSIYILSTNNVIISTIKLIWIQVFLESKKRNIDKRAHLYFSLSNF